MNVDNLRSPVICFGEILWDILPDGPQPGGAPLNVAYHLNKLGVGTSIISRIGNDANGQKLEDLLDSWGINKNLIQKDSKYPTSEVIASMGSGNEVTYEIVFPVAWDFIHYEKSIDIQMESADYLVYGSLSSRNDISRNTLFELLEGNGTKVFDINLRPPFYDKTILYELIRRADIVKFNEAELEISQSLFGGTFSKESDQVKYIQEKFQIPEIVVTRGESGASYYKNDDSYHALGVGIDVNDTIGSGDSFLAAFIAGHCQKVDP
ncbi:carbohydrate kinase family protein, partial [Daejeonella sp.]|uniref:carbohydrate kinase family protein n=1 Tax=Daejeonella sp. TaxID=2805397 RepID=UPI003983290A